METGSNKLDVSFQTIAEVGTLDTNSNFHNLHLSISIAEHYFGYAILDISKKKYVYHKRLQNNSVTESEQVVALNYLFKQESVLKKEFKTVSCAIINCGNTLVPASLYNEKLRDTYFDFNLINNTAFVSNHDFLSNLNAFNVYGILPEADELISKHFPNVKIFHYASILIESLLTRYRNKEKEQVFVTLYENFFDLIILKEGKLILNNSYTYHSVEDITYFLLFTCKELNINFEQAIFHYFGNTKKVNELFNVTKPYVKNVSVTNDYCDAAVDQNIKQSIVLEFPELFNQYRCV